MNEIVNKFLLDRDKFMPGMHLKQPGCTYRTITYEPFTKNKERIQKFKETVDTSYIYKDELDQVFFQCDMAYGDFKDIARKAAFDKVLTNRAFNIAKNLDINDYLLLWFTNVLIKSQKEVVLI